MKNKTTARIAQWLGFSVVMTVIGFSFAACDNGNDPGSGKGTAPAITTTTLQGGTAGTAYSQTLAATGNTPITWSIGSGTLPTGLSLAATGTIAGTPTTAGTSTFTVKATNAAGSGTKQFTITITDSAPTITTPALPNGVVGTAYSQTLAARGGTPITWSIDSGELPTGLNLVATTGTITGTPTTVDTYTFTVQATNAAGSGTKQFTITIVAVEITTTSLPDGVVGMEYSQTLAATSGTPITWTIDSGALPAGLNLGETTGVISGEPTEANTFSFTVKATNAAGDGTKPLSIIITGGGNNEPEIGGMVWIQGGTFTMGSPTGEADRYLDETQHEVTLTGFYMGKHPVTQAQYEAVTGSSNPSAYSSGGYRAPYVTGLDTANFPVEQVTWYDAVEFCNKLSEQEGLTKVYTITSRWPTAGHPITGGTVTPNWSANGYRLPTEAQWEYACRAGTTTAFNTGNNITTEQANYNGQYPYNDNPEGIYRERTTEVGTFAPNTLGLYDMHGNVYEWCWDLYGNYATGTQTDPTGAFSGFNRVRRGGSFFSEGHELRSAYRTNDTPSFYIFNTGFRIVRPAE